MEEQRGLRVFENRVLRKIFGPMMEELTGGWRRLHNEKLCSLYLVAYVTSLFRSSKMKCVLHDDVCIQHFTLGTSQEKRSLGSRK